TSRIFAVAARSAARAGTGHNLADGSSNGRPRGSTAVASCSSGGRRSRRTTSPSCTSPRPSSCGAHLWDRLLLPDALEKHLDRKSTGRIVTGARRAVRSAVGKIGRAKGQSPFVLYHPSARRVYQPAVVP